MSIEGRAGVTLAIITACISAIFSTNFDVSWIYSLNETSKVTWRLSWCLNRPSCSTVCKRPTNAQGSSGFLLIRSKFSTPTCFGICLPSAGGRECLISYSSNVLCYGRVRIMTRPVWPVVVERLAIKENWERINKNPLLPWAFVGLLQTVLQDARFNHQDPWLLSYFNETWIYLADFGEILKYQITCKSVYWGRTDMTKLTLAFLGVVNAP
jgi:hypothetical protein